MRRSGRDPDRLGSVDRANNLPHELNETCCDISVPDSNFSRGNTVTVGISSRVIVLFTAAWWRARVRHSLQYEGSSEALRHHLS